jgi:uncharacterized Fe-S cluster protein YjdI
MVVLQRGGPRRGVPVKEYRNDDIIVRFDPALCQHSGNCVRGLRAVFDVRRRPWVDVDGATPDEIAAQVRRCPSGALSFEMREGGAKSEPGLERRPDA